MARIAGSRLFWLAVVATVLGVGLWLASGAAIDASRLKGELQRDVHRATGRAFTIAGPLHVVMGLAPSISAEGVSLANAEGGSVPSMLTAGSVRAQVALLPLLSGHVVVEDVTLTDANIVVETGPDGTLNWQFQPQRHALVPGADAVASSGGGGGFDVHRIQLRDSHVTWRLAPARSLTVDLDNAAITADSPDSPMRGSADGHAYGVPISLSVLAGSFSRLEGGPVTALAGTWPMNVKLQAGQATLSLDGGVNHPDEWRGYWFKLTANAPDLAPLAPWLPSALALPLHDANLAARLSDGSNGKFRTSAVSLHVGTSDLATAVPGLSLREALLSAPGPGQQAQLSVDGTYQGAPLRLAGTTTQPDILAGAAPLPVTFSAEMASASFSAHGTVPPWAGANGFDLTVDLHAPNLAELSGLARRPLPDIRNLEFGAHLGDAGFKLRGLDMRDVTLQSSLGDVAGNLTVAWAPVLTLNGTLTSKQFDLDAAASAWTMLTASTEAAPAPAPAAVTSPPAQSPPAATTPPATFISDNPLPFAALHGADGDLTLSIDHMTFGGDTYRDVSARLLATSGRVVVNPLRMTAPQGIVIGGLTVDASAEPPQVALTFRSPGLSAAKVSAALGYPGGATGSLQVDAQLTSTGASPHALAAALDGHLGLSLVNGSVSDTVLQTMLGSALSRAGVPSFGGDVPVRCFASRTDFTHGIGHLQVLSLDTPQMTLGGNGNIDLGTETVSLHLRPTVRVGGTGVAAPVSLSGKFGDLKAELDPVMGGGRVGITIGGLAPSDFACAGQLSIARGGMPGPMPAIARQAGSASLKKPTDLLRGLFH